VLAPNSMLVGFKNPANLANLASFRNLPGFAGPGG